MRLLLCEIGEYYAFFTSCSVAQQHSEFNIYVLLTLGAHAPEGYGSCPVCVCVSVCVCVCVCPQP